TCPVEAISFKRGLDLPKVLQKMKEKREGRITKRHLLYETLSRIAVKQPSRVIQVPEGWEDFGEMDYDPLQCAAKALCGQCRDVCPEEAIDISRELDLSKIVGHPD
ncbi:MAG: hypothetical protein ACFFCW_21675, partial [Candidatus Hodarchaeota archaeon]